MSKPAGMEEPRAGLLIRYSYLWRDEARRGRQEGVKDRPCAVVLAVRREAQELRVYVAPVTHSPPAGRDNALEIPAATKQRLGLDDGRSWIVTTELKVFTWPGHDLRRVDKPGNSRGYAYGVLPRAMTVDLVRAVQEHWRIGRLRAVSRDER